MGWELDVTSAGGTAVSPVPCFPLPGHIVNKPRDRPQPAASS